MSTEAADEKPWLFKPGQSGNPGGRPEGDSLGKLLRAKMADVHPDEARHALANGRSPRTNAEVLADKLIQRAFVGDMKAVTIILERVDGKAVSKVQVDGKVEHAGTVQHEHGPSPTAQLLVGRLQQLRDKREQALLAAGAVVDAEVVP